MDTTHCMASAISAGLGAMTFRNHLRSLTEISDKTKQVLKTTGKFGVAAGAGAIAGYQAHKNGDQIITKVGEIGTQAGKAVDQAKLSGTQLINKAFRHNMGAAPRH